MRKTTFIILASLLACLALSVAAFAKDPRACRKICAEHGCAHNAQCVGDCIEGRGIDHCGDGQEVTSPGAAAPDAAPAAGVGESCESRCKHKCPWYKVAGCVSHCVSGQPWNHPECSVTLEEAAHFHWPGCSRPPCYPPEWAPHVAAALAEPDGAATCVPAAAGAREAGLPQLTFEDFRRIAPHADESCWDRCNNCHHTGKCGDPNKGGTCGQTNCWQNCASGHHPVCCHGC